MPRSRKQLAALLLLCLSSASCTLLFDTSPSATLDGGSDPTDDAADSGVVYCDSVEISELATLHGVQALDTNCDGSDEIFVFVDVGDEPEVWVRDSTCPLRANWDAQQRWLPTVSAGATTARLAVQHLALLDGSEICDDEAELIAIGPGVQALNVPPEEVWFGIFPLEDGRPTTNARRQQRTRQLVSVDECAEPPGVPVGPMHLLTGDFEPGDDPRPDDLTFTSAPGALWRYLRGDTEPTFDVSCESDARNVPVELSQTRSGATFGLLRLQGELTHDEVLEVGEQGLFYWRDSGSAFSDWQAIATASGAAIARGPLGNTPIQLAAVAWEDLRLTAQFITYSEAANGAGEVIYLTVTHTLEPAMSEIIAGAIIEHRGVSRVALLFENELALVHIPSDGLDDVETLRVPLTRFAQPPTTILTVRPGPGANEQLFVFANTDEYQCFEIGTNPIGLVPCS